VGGGKLRGKGAEVLGDSKTEIAIK
jgi:hypothetical protein